MDLNELIEALVQLRDREEAGFMPVIDMNNKEFRTYVVSRDGITLIFE